MFGDVTWRDGAALAPSAPSPPTAHLPCSLNPSPEPPGWIARAYLGQLDDTKRTETFSALVTLGTPHRPPPEGFFRTIDQTVGWKH